MSQLEEIIKQTSEIVFSGLETGDIRILKILGKKGFLSAGEINNELQKKNYTQVTFERWGIKKRMNGSAKFLGLIPNDYVIEIPINKKETKFGLTLKGFLTALGHIDFDKTFFVKRYKKFLNEKTGNPDILNWANEFMKSEIALILLYNKNLGVNWSKFIFLESYWSEFKNYDQDSISKYFLNKFFETNDEYNFVKKEFLKNFFLLDKTTETVECYFNRPFFDPPIEFKGTIRKFIDRWYQTISEPEISENVSYAKWEQYNELPSFDFEELDRQCNEPWKQAEKLLISKKIIKKTNSRSA